MLEVTRTSKLTADTRAGGRTLKLEEGHLLKEKHHLRISDTVKVFANKVEGREVRLAAPLTAGIKAGTEVTQAQWLHTQEDIHAEVWSHWGCIWKRHDREPNWDKFLEELQATDLGAPAPPAMGLFDLDLLKLAITEADAGKSLGWDAWSVQELRALGDHTLGRLAKLLQAIEDVDMTLAWPTALARAPVAWIPKTRGHRRRI